MEFTFKGHKKIVPGTKVGSYFVERVRWVQNLKTKDWQTVVVVSSVAKETKLANLKG